MNRVEAPELLLKSIRLDLLLEEYQKLGSAIVEELGYLALAIDQAGAYIASGECRLNDFLDVFNTYRQYLLQNEAYEGASGNDRAVYATWDLLYTAIRRQANIVVNEALYQGPKAALQILQLFPFLYNKGIIEDIFRSAAKNSRDQSKVERKANGRLLSDLTQLDLDGKWESYRFRQGIRTLLSFSLIGQESSQRRFFMYRLVHL